VFLIIPELVELDSRQLRIFLLISILTLLCLQRRLTEWLVVGGLSSFLVLTSCAGREGFWTFIVGAVVGFAGLEAQNMASLQLHYTGPCLLYLAFGLFVLLRRRQLMQLTATGIVKDREAFDR
jgi:hypothetical protein